MVTEPATKTLRQRLAELAAMPVLRLPADHDRRGMYAPEDGSASPRSSGDVPRTPDSRT